MSLNAIKVLSVITFGPGWCNKVHDSNTEWSDAITSISQAIHFRYLLFQKLKRKVLGIIWIFIWIDGVWIFCVMDVSMESQIQCISGSFILFYLSFVTPLNSNFITGLHDIKKYMLFLQKAKTLYIVFYSKKTLRQAMTREISLPGSSW